MTGLLLAAIFAATFGPPVFAFLRWASGPNKFQAKQIDGPTAKQKYGRAHAQLVAVIMTIAGSVTVYYTFGSFGYQCLVAAGLAVFASGAVSWGIGVAFSPEYEINGDALHTHTYDKHEVVRKHGFGGAIARILGRGKN